MKLWNWVFLSIVCVLLGTLFLAEWDLLFFWENVHWDIVSICLISLIALLELKHKHPTPELKELTIKNAECFNEGVDVISDENPKEVRHVFKIDLHLRNITSTPAMIERIEINDFILSVNEKEKTKVDVKTPRVLQNSCTNIAGSIRFPNFLGLEDSNLVDIRPDTTLNGFKGGVLRVVVALKDIPKKIKISVFTSNRKKPFNFFIKSKNMEEVADINNTCDWFFSLEPHVNILCDSHKITLRSSSAKATFSELKESDGYKYGVHIRMYISNTGNRLLIEKMTINDFPLVGDSAKQTRVTFENPKEDGEAFTLPHFAVTSLFNPIIFLEQKELLDVRVPLKTIPKKVMVKLYTPEGIDSFIIAGDDLKEGKGKHNVFNWFRN